MRYDIGDRVLMTIFGHRYSGSIVAIKKAKNELVQGWFYTVAFDKGEEWTARGSDLEPESPLESLALCVDP